MDFRCRIPTATSDSLLDVLLKFREWAGEHEGKRLTVRPLKQGRTLTQNAYYFLY